MHISNKLAIFGFLFGTVGMFVLAALSLVSVTFEVLAGPLFWPGRALSAALFGTEGSDVAVAFLTLCNGLFYAAIFGGIGALIGAVRKHK